MKHMYMVLSYSDVVYQIDVERETEKCIWYREKRAIGVESKHFAVEKHMNPCRIVKSTHYHDIVSTVEEGIEFIRARYERSIDAAKLNAKLQQERLEKFEEYTKTLLVQPLLDSFSRASKMETSPCKL
jgi:hypothetical protein